jgi:hypothetical protein
MNGGAASIPAREPTPAASAQPTVSITPTRTPDMRAASALNAAARIRRPSGVALNSTTTRAAVIAMATTTKRSLSEKRPRKSNAYGKLCGSLDQIIPATACSTMSNPSVTMIARSSSCRTGLTSTRSVTAPITRPARIAAAKPSQ